MEKFVKGQSGNPAGKPKGAIHRKHRIQVKVQEILDDLGFKPFEEAVKLIRYTNKERIRADLIMDLCSYIAPKLKQVEFKQDEENPFVISINFDPSKKSDNVNSVMEHVGNIIDQCTDDNNESQF